MQTEIAPYLRPVNSAESAIAFLRALHTAGLAYHPEDSCYDCLRHHDLGTMALNRINANMAFAQDYLPDACEALLHIRSDIGRLESLNLAICEATGAGKGHATTPEAMRAYRDELYRRRAEFAAAVMAARHEVAELSKDAETRQRGAKYRAYVEGCADALESVTRP